MIVDNLKFQLMNKTGVESKGCSVKEHRILKGIKMIINKFVTCMVCKKVRGPWTPLPPVVVGPVISLLQTRCITAHVMACRCIY